MPAGAIVLYNPLAYISPPTKVLQLKLHFNYVQNRVICHNVVKWIVFFRSLEKIFIYTFFKDCSYFFQILFHNII
jgi:hypothetical protein